MTTERTPFSDLTQESKDILAACMSRHDFNKGAEVVHKGQEVSGAYFVLSGRLRVYAISPTGREATLYPIDPGETCVLALNSLFNDLLYPAWVEAETDTRVGVVPGPVYRALFAREQIIQDLTVRALSAAVFRLMDQLEQIHGSRLDQRLVAFLLSRANGAGVVEMTQQSIASQLGSTREVIAKLLNRLAAQKLLQTGRGRVQLLQPQKLAKYGGEELTA